MTLLIEYEQALVPDGGSDVCCSFALAKHANKDAAGHAFHDYALLQAGVAGISQITLLILAKFQWPIQATARQCMHPINAGFGAFRWRGGPSRWSDCILSHGCCIAPQALCVLLPPPAAAAGVLAIARHRCRERRCFMLLKHHLPSCCSAGSDSSAEDDSAAEVGSSASRASLLDDTIPEGWVSCKTCPPEPSVLAPATACSAWCGLL